MTDIDRQNNKILLNLIAQLIYSPDESTADAIGKHLGITRRTLLAHEKPVLVECIILGLLDKRQASVFDV